MLKIGLAAAAALIANPSAAPNASEVPAGLPVTAAKPGEKLRCQYVVTPQRGTKPVRLCLTKAEWGELDKKNAKDATRMVCRYEAASHTRFRSYKICMTAAEWENQRQLERQQIERIQSGTCVAGGGC